MMKWIQGAEESDQDMLRKEASKMVHTLGMFISLLAKIGKHLDRDEPAFEDVNQRVRDYKLGALHERRVCANMIGHLQNAVIKEASK